MSKKTVSKQNEMWRKPNGEILAYGITEMRQGSSQFSLSIYAENNPDVASAFSDPKDRISHFMECAYYGSEKHSVCI